MLKIKKLVVLFFAVLTLYSIFSFSLTDPNLVFTSWSPFVSFQQWMWDTFFHNSELLTSTYIVLIALLFGIYVSIIKKSELLKISVTKKHLIVYLLLISPLLISYNALSHDVFNYIFNAKMVTQYHENPHVKVALDFPEDEWVRFMHNTHTPAPYGYGWTAFSLIPYQFGMGKFVPTWFVFRLASVLSIVFLFYVLKFLSSQFKTKLSLFHFAVVFLNPLFIIEVVSNMHNDLWMMAPAMLSLALIAKNKKKKISYQVIALSLLLLAFSISTKLVTVVLLPIWLLLFVINNSKKLIVTSQKFNEWWPLLASIALFIPLLTSRSQQFHPWYLLWIIVWIPYIKVDMWKKTIMILSVTSLMRYVPWLLVGGFEENTLLFQKIITWLIPIIYIIWSTSSKKTDQLKVIK